MAYSSCGLHVLQNVSIQTTFYNHYVVNRAEQSNAVLLKLQNKKKTSVNNLLSIEVNVVPEKIKLF